MITSIEIKSGDKLTITRSTIRFHGVNPSLGVVDKWTVTSHTAAFEQMFLQLCGEVGELTTLAGRWDGGEKTVFTVTEESGNKMSYVLNQPEERYRACFTIIDQMVREEQ